MNTQQTQTEKTGNGADTGAAMFGTGSGSSMSTSGESKAVQHSEGKVARAIEEQTAKLPSDTFLWAACGAIAASAIFQFTGHKDKSRFVGQWVAPFLLLGVYNKLVKVQGSDRIHG